MVYKLFSIPRLGYEDKCGLYLFVWSIQNYALWRRGDCVPVCMVYQGLSCVEKWRLFTCLYGVPRSKLCWEVKTVYLSVWYTKDCTVWRVETCTVHCVPVYMVYQGLHCVETCRRCVPVCMVYQGLSCVEKWRLCTCLYGIPRTALCGELRRVQYTVYLSIWYTKDCTVWRRVDCVYLSVWYTKV